MNSDEVVFEIIEYEKYGETLYDIKNIRYNTLNRYGIKSHELYKAMRDIADVVNNDINRGCCFTIA